MKILLAPDSFKGSLTSAQAARILADAAETVLGCETIALPVADGGEGTLEAIVDAAGGAYVDLTATGPLGIPVQARYGMIDGGETAVIEMARASGITLAKPLDPIRATSRGTGDLIADAIRRGARRFTIAIGGSATNDGGMGMLSALGARFFDAAGNLLAGSGGDLERLASADLSALPKIDITVICDVTNPLLGPSGATRVYGPQKGADEKTLDRLERGMENYAAVLQISGDFPGAGAAGGMGYALAAVFGGRMKRGIDAVLDAVNFDSLLDGVDLVVTGEGRLDGQSVRYGKVPAGIAMRALARGIPTIAVAGGLGEGAEAFLGMGMTSLEPITDGPRTLESSIENAEALLAGAARRLFSTLKIGMALAK
jgi:glycerate kinase